MNSNQIDKEVKTIEKSNEFLEWFKIQTILEYNDCMNSKDNNKLLLANSLLFKYIEVNYKQLNEEL